MSVTQLDDRWPTHARGFTLVELLVVIGIIGLLVAILLPVLGSARQQANLLVCQAQLRSHMQTLLIYAGENRGSMPWGFAWRQTAVSPTGLRTGGPNPADYYWGDPARFYRGYSWQVTVNSMQRKLNDGFLWPNDSFAGDSSVDRNRVKLGDSFTCPEMKGDSVLNAKGPISSYGANSLILVNQSFEMTPGVTSNWRFGFNPDTKWLSGATFNAGTTFAIGPAKLTQLYADNAVLWDTAVMAEGAITGAWLWDVNTWGGMTVSGIDNGRLLQPTLHSLRYRSMAPPRVLNADQGIDQSIFYPAPSSTYSNITGSFKPNGDLIYGIFLATIVPLPDALNIPRFRHVKSSTCNVAFADGSVRAVKWNPRKVQTTSYNRVTAANEFERKWLMIKPQAALPPSR